MERLNGIVDATFSSTTFLSRLPTWRLKSEEEASSLPNFQRSAHAFPLAGIVIALPAVIVFWLTSLAGLPATISALLTVVALMFTTGALHEDGLADVADGFWGGHTLERKLEIMRDSAIGTYGVLALVASFGLRAACIAALAMVRTPEEVAMLVIAVASLSRAAMVWPWVLLPAVRPAQSDGLISGIKEAGGLSVRYGEPDRQTGLWTLIFCAPALLLLLSATGLVGAINAVLIGALFVTGGMLVARRHVGGHTGDVLGAVQQMCEIGLYIGLLIAI
ncbi:adenosylcobinamide-GDP ribazoletransferase [Pseudahrensia aquimaris]|uniref:Adenosylcobinamide-GDP ribazoletransferase n=1 Tax=Pseudahrensia aquimaris TaxID=744461 RepID=A0ABW3FCK2_9HYPH